MSLIVPNYGGKKYEIINNDRLLDYSILFQFKNFIISPSSFSFWPAMVTGRNSYSSTILVWSFRKNVEADA